MSKHCIFCTLFIVSVIITIITQQKAPAVDISPTQLSDGLSGAFCCWIPCPETATLESPHGGVTLRSFALPKFCDQEDKFFAEGQLALLLSYHAPPSYMQEFYSFLLFIASSTALLNASSVGWDS